MWTTFSDQFMKKFSETETSSGLESRKFMLRSWTFWQSLSLGSYRIECIVVEKCWNNF